MGCLDYIFLSQGCKTVDLRNVPTELPELKGVLGDDVDYKGPFPNAMEPSDHLMIAATIELP